MFSVEQRDRVHDRVLELAEADPRVVAGAVVGSLALGPGDRWSDLDLTFGLADRVPLHAVLDDWTGELARDFDAVHLFDLASPPAIYRVFLLPGFLQVDLSVAPASEFRARGPRFRLLFGSAREPAPPSSPPSPQHLVGLSVHHVVRARVSIERGRRWQAEYWIGQIREHALELACARHGLAQTEGRGVDELPAAVLEPFESALVRSPERGELLRALRGAVEVLLRESAEVPDLAPEVAARLRELAEG